MKDIYKTKKQLIEELKALRDQLAAFSINNKPGQNYSNIEQFCHFADMARDIIIIYGLDASIQYMNSAAIEFSGYSVDEIGKLSAWDFIPPDYRPKIEDYLTLRLDNDRTKYLFELEVFNKKGQRAAVEVSSSPIVIDNEIKAVLAIARNITERRSVEVELKQSELKYRHLFECANDAIFMMDQDMFIDCNSMTLRMFNCTKDQIIGRPPYLFSPEYQADGRDSKTKALEKINAALDGQPQFFEWQHSRYNGEVFDAEVSLNRMVIDGKYHLLAIVREITERKQAIEALKRSESQFQELFNSVMEGIGIIDENEIIRFCNPAYAGIFDADSPDDLVGKSFTQFVAEKDKKNVEANIEKRKKGISSQYELEIITLAGNRKNILISVSPRYNAEKQYIGTFGAIIDITETKSLQEFAHRAQRLEIAGRISGQIAHDFNNLLGPLTAYPDIIRKKLPDGHPALSYVEKMAKSAAQMAEINQELLVLGRRGHYNLEPLNLNELINQLENHILPHNENRTISADLSDNLMNIKGGSSQICRLLSNLLSNAWDAMGGSGEVRLKTENYYIDARVPGYGVVPKGEYVKLTVSDKGCGIPDNIRAKIFDPFFTTKTTDLDKGSGLGLSVVHAVMEDHNGYIDMESLPGKGTSFYLYFPITRELSEATVLDRIVGGSESVLVVDDDPAQREIAVTLLNELGYRAKAVESGEKAVELMKTAAFDLLILDMIMSPGIDGAETYKRVLEINPHQKAIIVSGYAETKRVEQARHLGVGAYIRKPLTLKSISQAVRAELDRRLAPAIAR